MVEPVKDEGNTLGQMFRAQREARGLSQELAARQARVQLVFVRALEDDDYRLLPDRLYLSRFVHEYAAFLGLDPATAGATFRRQSRREPGPASVYLAVPRLAALPWRTLLWAAAGMLPLVPLSFIVLSLAGKERDMSPPLSPAAAAAIVGDWSPPEPAAAPGPLSTAPPPRHLLLVRARELAWLAVKMDGGAEHEVLLREGEMVRWRAQREFQLSVANAGGVELVLDGRPVAVPARRGEVIRTLRLPQNSRPSK